jgi:hypothetical protein
MEVTMLIKDIPKLQRIHQKSRGAEFGCCFNGESFYFFNIGIYEWVCNMDFDSETEPPLESHSYFLDPDALRQICDIFTDGDVSVVREGNNLVMSQGSQRFVMAVRNIEEGMVKLPNTMGGKTFATMGKLTPDVVDMTKMPLKGNLQMESLLVLHQDLVSRQSGSFMGLTRKVEWEYFPSFSSDPKENVLYIEAEVIRYLDDPVLSYNGACFKLVSDGVSLVLPKSEPVGAYHYSDTFTNFKSEHCKDYIHISRKSIVAVTDLVSKLFSDKPTLSSLKFEATEEGFKVECGDNVALFTHTLVCESQFVEGFVFHVNSKLLSNLKYIDVEMIYIQFCYRNNAPIQMVFFSDQDKGYEASDFVCVASVQNKA